MVHILAQIILSYHYMIYPWAALVCPTGFYCVTQWLPVDPNAFTVLTSFSQKLSRLWPFCLIIFGNLLFKLKLSWFCILRSVYRPRRLLLHKWKSSVKPSVAPEEVWEIDIVSEFPEVSAPHHCLRPEDQGYISYSFTDTPKSPIKLSVH